MLSTLAKKKRKHETIDDWQFYPRSIHDDVRLVNSILELPYQTKFLQEVRGEIVRFTKTRNLPKAKPSGAFTLLLVFKVLKITKYIAHMIINHVVGATTSFEKLRRFMPQKPFSHNIGPYRTWSEKKVFRFLLAANTIFPNNISKKIMGFMTISSFDQLIPYVDIGIDVEDCPRLCLEKFRCQHGNICIDKNICLVNSNCNMVLDDCDHLVCDSDLLRNLNPANKYYFERDNSEEFLTGILDVIYVITDFAVDLLELLSRYFGWTNMLVLALKNYLVPQLIGYLSEKPVDFELAIKVAANTKNIYFIEKHLRKLRITDEIVQYLMYKKCTLRVLSVKELESAYANDHGISEETKKHYELSRKFSNIL